MLAPSRPAWADLLPAVSFNGYPESSRYPTIVDGPASPWRSPAVVYRDARRQLTVVVTEEQYRWLCDIERALSCRTWGELRASAPHDVYLELLDFAGYGDLADVLYETFSGRGASVWPALIAEWQHRTGERLPADAARFDAERLEPVLGGAYPPDPWILMADVVPRRLLHAYDRAWRETIGLGIDDRDIVATLLADLSRQGLIMRNARDPHERARQVSTAS